MPRSAYSWPSLLALKSDFFFFFLFSLLNVLFLYFHFGMLESPELLKIKTCFQKPKKYQCSYRNKEETTEMLAEKSHLKINSSNMTDYTY